jgi:hypothetical protein
MAEGKTAGGVICESLVGPARSEILDHIVTSPGIGRSAWFKDPGREHHHRVPTQRRKTTVHGSVVLAVMTAGRRGCVTCWLAP